METRRATLRRKAKILRRLRMIESAAMFLSGMCFLLVIFFGACLDGPNWEAAFGLAILFGVGCRVFYEIAVWAHDKEA